MATGEVVRGVLVGVNDELGLTGAKSSNFGSIIKRMKTYFTQMLARRRRKKIVFF